MQISTIDQGMGLPSNQVHTLAQDPFDRLWLAGPAGLSRYDGNTIKCFDRSNGLRCHGLRSVAVGPQGHVWIGTDQGLETLDQDGTPVKWAAEPAWRYGLVDCVAALDGETWAGTPQGLVQLTFERIGGTCRAIHHAALGYVRDIQVVEPGHLILVSATQGLVDIVAGALRPWSTPGQISGEAITCLGDGAHKLIIVGTQRGAIIPDRDSGEVLHTLLPIAGSTAVTAIAVIGAEWWVAYGHTLCCFVEMDGTPIRRVDLKLDSKINALRSDRHGNLWVATDSRGLKKISCLRHALEEIDTGAATAAVHVVKPERDGHLRIAGYAFSRKMKIEADGNVTRSDAVAHLPDTIVWDECPDPSDETVRWLATQDGLLRVRPGEAPERIGATHPLLSGPCRTLLPRDGELWVGSLAGLCRVRGKHIEEIRGSGGEAFGYVYVYWVDEDGKMWIGTLGNGLWHETAGGLEQVAGGPLSPQGNTYAIVRGPDGNLLVLQDERVILLDKNLVATAVGTEFPVAGWAAVWLTPGTFAVGASDGLRIVQSSSGVLIQKINAMLPKGDWEFTNCRSLAKGPDGRLYCGLVSGLVAVDLAALQQFAVPPTVRLSGIDWTNVEPERENDTHYRLSQGKWSVDFQAYAAWLIDESQVRYRFQLVGFERAWSALQDHPDIRFSSLPPGRYQLQAQAYTPLTGFGEVACLCTLTVSTPWWAFGWVAVTSSLGTLYRRLRMTRTRNADLIRQSATLEQEVASRLGALSATNDELRHAAAQLADINLALQEATNRAQIENRLKSTFLSTMSHELRTPLNSIIGFTGILGQELAGPLNAEQHKQIGMVQKSGKHLLALINDVLDISRIEAGKLSVLAEPFDLRASVKKVLDVVQPLADQKGLTMTRDISADIGPAVSDARRIEQILLNVLGNAIKFTERGNVSVTVDTQNGSARLKVADSGMGIKPEDIKLLFTPFHQLEPDSYRVTEGTGLGLAICQRLVHLLGGTITIESNFGEGSVVTIILPLDRSAANEAKNGS